MKLGTPIRAKEGQPKPNQHQPDGVRDTQALRYQADHRGNQQQADNDFLDLDKLTAAVDGITGVGCTAGEKEQKKPDRAQPYGLLKAGFFFS